MSSSELVWKPLFEAAGQTLVGTLMPCNCSGWFRRARTHPNAFRTHHSVTLCGLEDVSLPFPRRPQ